MSVREEDPELDPPSPVASLPVSDSTLDRRSSADLQGRNDQLERENQLLRQRLRQAEKEVTLLKARANVKTQPNGLSEARRRVATADANEESVRRAVDNRDEALLEMRRHIESLKLQQGKSDQEEVPQQKGDPGGEDDTWTATTTGTAYDTADEDEDGDEATGPIQPVAIQT